MDEQEPLLKEYSEIKKQQIEIQKNYIEELKQSWPKCRELITSLKRQSKTSDIIPTCRSHQAEEVIENSLEEGHDSRDRDITSKISEDLNALLFELKDKFGESGLVGSFHPIGSTPSGTGLSKSTDFDYIYELSRADIRVEFVDKSHKCIVHRDGAEVKPQQIYDEFKTKLDSLFLDKHVKLPGGLRFGGFAKPNYSGIRLCEPAVTTLLQWKDEAAADAPLYDVPVDITVGFRLPSDQEEIAQHVQDKIIYLFNRKLDINIDIKPGIHLVPVSPEDGKWYMSTAVLETKLLKELPEEHSAKLAIQKCKQVNQLLVEALKPSIDEEISAFINWLRSSLLFHNNSDNFKSSKLESVLREILSIAHVLLSKEQGEIFGETCTKSPLAINSSAIKYQTFNLLNGNNNTHTTHTARKLQLSVLDTFCTGDGLIDHTFLGSKGCYKIHQFTVACYCAKQKIELYCAAQAILREISVKIKSLAY